MNKPKVLIITGALPYPLTTGAKIRTFNLMKALAPRFDIELLTVLGSPKDRTHVEIITKNGIKCHYLVRIGAESHFSRILDAVLSFILHDPYLIRHYTFSVYRKTLDALLSEQNYDVIHCDSISMTGNLYGLDRKKLVLTEHNIEQNIWAGYAEHASGIVMKLFLRNQFSKVVHLEANLDRTYGNIVTVSENDRQILARTFPEDKITVVENGVDPEAYRNDLPVEKRSGLIFTGSLDWHPNIDGLTWFVQDVYPELLNLMPLCRTSIVGRRPSGMLRAAIGDKLNIKLHADVPEIQPYLHKARVMMVPLRIGGGSRLKILEALAAGIPVVSTSKGAEGLAVTNGEDIVIEDNPKRFAEAIVQLMQDDDLHIKLSQRGRALIERRYSWDQVSLPLADLWERIAHA